MARGGSKLLNIPWRKKGMFEKYTETARRVIFHARHEASRFGSQYIETEHLLLGILRTDRFLAIRLCEAPEKVESIREQIEKQFPPQSEKIPTSVDLPVSRECKRVLKYAAEEAERLKDERIAAGHLLLGLLRVGECAASKIMSENGLTPAQVEQALLPEADTSAAGPVAVPSLPESSRDLTTAARNGTLNPLIGRERELDRIIEILSRRARNNPVLIGEPGVGKNAIVEGLAQRIADGAVPETLGERPILAIDASSLLSNPSLVPNRPNAILYVQGLFDLAGKGAGWSVVEAVRVLEPHLTHGGMQCIATGTPFGLRLTVERAESLARQFEVVPVPEPTEEEAIRIVWGVNEQYEKFHGVTFTHEAIETAVFASRWFLRHRQLPDRAIDLIDDAGARVKLRGLGEPPEIVEILRRIRAVVRSMENAIANHEFDKARFYSEEERRERQNLQSLRAELGQKSPVNVVNPDDIVEAVASRARVPVEAVRNLLELKVVEPMESIARELAAQFPIGGREWAEALAAWLAGCSAEDAEGLASAIRAAKGRLTH
jgi:ATP-dependent Clp protease ATP-binding subunit ClpC